MSNRSLTGWGFAMAFALALALGPQDVIVHVLIHDIPLHAAQVEASFAPFDVDFHESKSQPRVPIGCVVVFRPSIIIDRELRSIIVFSVTNVEDEISDVDGFLAFIKQVCLKEVRDEMVPAAFDHI